VDKEAVRYTGESWRGRFPPELAARLLEIVAEREREA
jgi:hypothetical protein